MYSLQLMVMSERKVIIVSFTNSFLLDIVDSSSSLHHASIKLLSRVHIIYHKVEYKYCTTLHTCIAVRKFEYNILGFSPIEEEKEEIVAYYDSTTLL